MFTSILLASAFLTSNAGPVQVTDRTRFLDAAVQVANIRAAIVRRGPDGIVEGYRVLGAEKAPKMVKPNDGKHTTRLTEGDLITHINGQPVRSRIDLFAAATLAQSNGRLTLLTVKQPDKPGEGTSWFIRLGHPSSSKMPSEMPKAKEPEPEGPTTAVEPKALWCMEDLCVVEDMKSKTNVRWTVFSLRRKPEKDLVYTSNVIVVLVSGPDDESTCEYVEKIHDNMCLIEKDQKVQKVRSMAKIGPNAYLLTEARSLGTHPLEVLRARDELGVMHQNLKTYISDQGPSWLKMYKAMKPLDPKLKLPDPKEEPTSAKKEA